METFDDKVFLMKGYLMSGIPKHVVRCVNWIKMQLDAATEGQKEEIITKLINYNFIDQFYKQLVTCNASIRYQMIEVLRIFNESKSFYKKQGNLLSAFNAILKITEASMNNSETVVLEATISTLLCTIKGCERYEIPLGLFFESRKILSILEKLKDKKLAYSALISAAEILCFVLSDDSLEMKTERKLLLSVLTHFLQELREVVTAFEQIGSKIIDAVIEAILAICEACIPFYDDDDNANAKGCCSDTRCKGASSRKKERTISSLIHFTMLDFIVPRMKSYNCKPETKVFENFLYCSNEILETEKKCKYVFAKSISSYGYLTYFLEISGNFELRARIRKLLAKIMKCLIPEMFPIYTNQTNNEDTLENIIQGVYALPSDPTALRELIGALGPPGDALLMLSYIHFAKTNEIYLFSFESLFMKFNQFTGITANSVFSAKALWLLLAATATLPCDLVGYTSALNKLNDFLKSAENCINCYSHHPALLMHCLQEAKMSDFVRAKVVELWLKNSNGGISEILKSNDTDILTRDFVISGILETPSDIVKTIMTIVEDSKQGSSSRLAWKCLEYYTNQACDDSTLEVVLEFAYDIEEEEMEAQNLKAGGKSLRSIIFSDIEFKIQVIALSVIFVVLEEMKRRRDIEFFQLYSEDTELLKKLRCLALMNTPRNDALRCIFVLLVARQELSITTTSAAAVTFSADEIFNMLIRMSEDPHRTLAALEMLNFCLNNKTESALVKIDIPIEQENDSLENLFVAVVQMHVEVLLHERYRVYRCLISLLQFSKEWKASALPGLVQMVSVEIMVRDVIEQRKVSQEFLDFLIIWLQCRKECMPQVSTSYYGQTMFGEVLQVLNKFLQSLVTCKIAHFWTDEFNALKSLVDEQMKVYNFSQE